ncbi:MAG: DNA-binding protein [Candidatus Omnitrophica bacterium]|nr:DNA-binding protein [Candidatus Omnitrophota bacterium]
MKVKSFFFFAILCLVLLVVSYNCYAQTSTSLELINNAKQYDGKTINYKGEVIGDVMIRQDYAWLQVNDGIIAIGIWAPKTMIQDILYAGNYHKKGDIVEVSGIFHRSCLEHGGDLDIHASEIKKITSGSPVIQPISRKKAYFGAYSLVIVLLFYALKKFFQSRKK